MDESAKDMDLESREAAHKAFRRAVALAGSQSAFARLIGTSQQNVNNWLRKRWVAPLDFVEKIEGVTGISRHDLRPDIYPREGGSPASDDRMEGIAA